MFIRLNVYTLRTFIPYVGMYNPAGHLAGLFVTHSLFMRCYFWLYSLLYAFIYIYVIFSHSMSFSMPSYEYYYLKLQQFKTYLV